MRTGTRLGLFGLGLAIVFAGSLGAGRLAGPRATPPPPPAEHGEEHDTPEVTPLSVPGGLQVAQDGYRLEVLTASLPAAPFRFRVIGPDGRPVTSYVRNHEQDLHLIVVRRDLSGYQHVHPTLDGDGVWSIPLPVGAAGQYRVLADFQPVGRDKGLTLGVDVPAAGDYQPVPLPTSGHSAEVDGYHVTISGELVPGTTSKLVLSVKRNGIPVSDLDTYLGAFGHLVALRDGDLAYLHVHPEESSTAGPDITFYAEVPSAGTYRLFLDFKHGGVVRTAAFTQEGHRP